MRTPYIMSEDEIQALIAGFISHGLDETYVRMKTRALFVMDKTDDLDQEFLDRSTTLLNRGRKELAKDDDDAIFYQKMYYTLSFMIRKLAHEIHREYIKRGKPRNSERFIHLVSYNKNAPTMI